MDRLFITFASVCFWSTKIIVKTTHSTLVDKNTCLKTMLHENEADRKQGKQQSVGPVLWSSETEY